MKILVVSHSCSSAINQQIYAEISRITGWAFTLLIPRGWKDEFGNRSEGRLWPSFNAELVTSPILLNGNIILHGYLKRIRPWLRQRRFDAVYVNHEPYAVATAQWCLGNRGDHQALFGFYSCQNIKKTYPLPFRWLERWVYRSSQFAFPITSVVSDVLREKGYRGASSVAPLPVDPKIYRPRFDENLPEVLKEHKNGLLIGYVGRIVEAKGLRTLVLGLAKLATERWTLAIVGTGPFELELDALLRENGIASRVIRLGFIPHEETPRYLAAFDVLVVPSETQANWKEQFGRVIVEALACGTPVVGSDSGEIPKLVGASGGGWVFAERDPDALAAALRNVMRDAPLRQRFAREGRLWAVSNMSVERVASSMAATLESEVQNFRASCIQRV